MNQKSQDTNNTSKKRTKSIKNVNKKRLSEYSLNPRVNKTPCYLQNRELSWLKFNERVLEQGKNKDNPLLERLNFTSIFSSNLQEFYMVRVGSITDLTLVKEPILDNKSGMSPQEQIDAINKECHRLYPIQEEIFNDINSKLSKKGISFLRSDDLSNAQKKFIKRYAKDNILPFLSPQIINAQHPFPHLENGAIYVTVRLANTDTTLGIIPLPSRCERIIKLPISADNTKDIIQYTLLEQAIKLIVKDVFSMYKVKRSNIICVTRNADLDVIEGYDEIGDDFREHMKRILKKRTRLAPVRLETERELSNSGRQLLMEKLNVREDQIFFTKVPLDMSYCGDLANVIPEKIKTKLKYVPFRPQWSPEINPNKSFMKQIRDRDFILSYPYDSFDPMVRLIREAALDSNVVSIRITLYRLSKQSRLAEALIAAAEAGKDVTALFELRARFDENNNIRWSQRFEEAGAKVLYGFENYKVHSKVCAIVRRKGNGKIERFTQFGTGNYNETTAKLYTDFAYFTSNEEFGKDAEEFFRNMALENISDNYRLMCVAPLQIKRTILSEIDKQITRKQQGLSSGIFFKTNSVTDIQIIRKIVEASKAGVKITILCRGISCLVPGLEKYTENVRIVSIVGRLLEHSRIYGFGDGTEMKIYLSSADLMTRNMNKRVEVAWPVLNETLRLQVIDYIYTCLTDTAKLRELMPNGSYSIPQGSFDAQEQLIKEAYENVSKAAKQKVIKENKKKVRVQNSKGLSFRKSILRLFRK